ncbi:MAG: hypothetical protein DWI00_07710 [Planctomycetota bacterium]|nr:MAG: hypothetical protein DWI00_07710 [Planctomycetota bacterium]
MDIEMDFADRVLLRKTHDNNQPRKNDIHNLSLEPLNKPTRGAFLSGWITEGKFLGKLTARLRSPLSAVTVSSGIEQSVPVNRAMPPGHLGSSNSQEHPAQPAIE